MDHSCFVDVAHFYIVRGRTGCHVKKKMRDCPENKTCSGGDELSNSSYLIQEPIGRANMGRNHACGVVLQASPGQRGSAREETSTSRGTYLV